MALASPREFSLLDLTSGIDLSELVGMVSTLLGVVSFVLDTALLTSPELVLGLPLGGVSPPLRFLLRELGRTVDVAETELDKEGTFSELPLRELGRGTASLASPACKPSRVFTVGEELASSLLFRRTVPGLCRRFSLLRVCLGVVRGLEGVWSVRLDMALSRTFSLLKVLRVRGDEVPLFLVLYPVGLEQSLETDRALRWSPLDGFVLLKTPSSLYRSPLRDFVLLGEALPSLY